MTAAFSPIPMRWDGENMTPITKYHAKRADEQYVVGEVYQVLPVEERSSNSHRAYFAELHTTYSNLPEDRAEQFVNETHFRRWCLIKCGFCNVSDTVCSSKAEAERLAAFARAKIPYIVAVVKDRVVTVYEAKSQDYHSMDKKEFAASSQAVLDLAASLIGATREQLRENA